MVDTVSVVQLVPPTVHGARLPVSKPPLVIRFGVASTYNAIAIVIKANNERRNQPRLLFMLRYANRFICGVVQQPISVIYAS